MNCMEIPTKTHQRNGLNRKNTQPGGFDPKGLGQRLTPRVR